MLKKCAYFLFFCLPVFLQASIFDWFDPLSPKAQRAKDLLESYDPIIQNALKEYMVPGVAVGVVVDGRVVYAKGFGYRDLEKKAPVTADTLFCIGSCTKAFTSFLIGTLIDEGLVAWDQPVIDLLPEFRLWDQYATQNLTLRDLLTHRSGMPRHDWMWYNSSISRSELLKRIRYLEPSAEIRERYQYGNLMYFIVGCAMERITKKSWEDLVSDRILKPLKMTQTNFSVKEMQKGRDFAFPYIEKNEILKKMPFRDLSIVGPAASINSNVTDLCHWVQLQLNNGTFNGHSLISASTLQEMHAPQVIVPGAPETKESLLYAYGIGWSILSYKGHYFLSHDGAPDGFTSVIGLLPAEGIGLVILANKNLTSFSRYLSFELMDRLLELPSSDWLKEGIEGIKRGKETSKEKKIHEDSQRKKGTSPSHPLSEFVGEYEHPGYGKISVELIDGKLHSTYNGITSILAHWHYDVFSIAEEMQDILVSLVGTKITFRNNLNGEVEEMIVPYEPQSESIVFKKKAAGDLSTLSHLRQFVGVYEIYGYTVEVVIRDNSLHAIIPGQPIYQLVPYGEHEFTVKSMTGTTVRFVMDEMNRVKEVDLNHPYGTFTATRKG